MQDLDADTSFLRALGPRPQSRAPAPACGAIGEAFDAEMRAALSAYLDLDAEIPAAIRRRWSPVPHPAANEVA